MAIKKPPYQIIGKGGRYVVKGTKEECELFKAKAVKNKELFIENVEKWEILPNY